MIPTPIPPVIELAPVAVAVPSTELFQLLIGGATALAALIAAVVGAMNLFHLQRIHVQFNSVWHEFLAKTESLALAQGASEEREKRKTEEEKGR